MSARSSRINRTSSTSSGIIAVEPEVGKEGSSSSSSSSRQKRKSVDPVDEYEGNADRNIFSNMTLGVNYRIKNISVSPKELSNFGKLSEDAQKNCIKAVSRLFVLKGGRKESVARAAVTEALGKVDETFKKHSSAVLSLVQTQLRDMLGYDLLSAADIKGVQGSVARGDVFYLASAMAQKSPLLSAVLHRGGKDLESGNCYAGLRHVLFIVLLTTAGRRCAAAELLRQARKVDQRLPETLPTKAARASSSSSSYLFPHLEEDFMGLLERMRKEGYLAQCAADQQDGSDIGDSSKTVYTFGPRFHLEIGLLNLARSFYAMLGQPPDEGGYLQTLRQELEAAEGD